MQGGGDMIEGACHCRRVRFEAVPVGGLDGAIRCNCSLCRMRGAVVVFAAVDSLRIVAGEDELACYAFNTGRARHYFCRTCGIYTHHQRRFDPGQFAINVACLEGRSPFDFDDVPVVDGAHHPLDHGGGPMKVVGRLRYVRAADA